MDSLGGSLGAAEGQITLDASKALSALTQVSVGLRNLDQQSQKQGTGLLSWAGRNEQALNTVGAGLLGVGAAFLGSFGLATKTAMNFDAAISAVGSVAGASGQELSALREEALRLGADTTLGATEAASAMEIMLKAGASLESVLNGGAEAAINLSEATGVDITLAAETAATAMNLFGISAEDAANLIAQSSNASSLDVNDWALALKSVGPIAKSLGLDMDDLSQAMVILGDAGIKGEVGGTALRNILMGLADPAGEASLGLAELGVATHDAQGNFRGLEEITHDLAGSWGTMDAAQKLQIATMIAGEQGAASFMAIMDAQTDAVNDGTDAFQDASKRMKATGTVSEQAAARMDNLKGSFEQLKGTVETVAITFTSGLAPAMRFVVDGANRLLQGVLALPDPLKTTIAALTGIAGAAGVAAGGFLLLLPRIAETANAFKLLTNSPTVVAGLTKSLGLLRVAMLGLFANPLIIGGIAVVAAAFLAYKTNFLGFEDLVDGAYKKVTQFYEFLFGAPESKAVDLTVDTTADNAFDLWHVTEDGQIKNTELGITLSDTTPADVLAIIDPVTGEKSYQLVLTEPDGSQKSLDIVDSSRSESNPDLFYMKANINGEEVEGFYNQVTGEWSEIPSTVVMETADADKKLSHLQQRWKDIVDWIGQAGTLFKNIWLGNWEQIDWMDVLGFDRLMEEFLVSVEQIWGWIGKIGEAWSTAMNGGMEYLKWFNDEVLGGPEDGVGLSSGSEDTNMTPGQVSSEGTTKIRRDKVGTGENALGSNYADPYNPMRGGSSRTELTDIGPTAFELEAYAATMDRLHSAGGTARTTMIELFGAIKEGQAPTQQGAIDMNLMASTAPIMGGAMQSAGAQVGAAGAGIGSTFAGIAASALANFTAAQVATVTQMGALAAGAAAQALVAKTGVTSQFASMSAGTIASALGMQSGVAARMAALQASVTSQASSARANAISQFSSMSSGTAGKFLGMQAQSAVQMALMASSANTQGAAVNTNLTKGVSNAVSSARSTLAQLSGVVAGAGASAAWSALSAGANIGNSFASGMESALGRIRAAASAMVAAADSAVIARARIASPSKMALYWADMIAGRGFVDRILSYVPKARDAMASLVTPPNLQGFGMPSPAFSAPFVGGGGYGGGGQQVVYQIVNHNNYVTPPEMVKLIDGSEKGRSAYSHLSDPDAFNYGGGD